MRRLAACLLLIGLMGLAAPAHAQGSTIQALAIGDSITYSGTWPTGYGPIFEKKFENRGLGKAAYRGTAGATPCDAWADWVRDYPKVRLDFVVIEDYAPGGAPCVSLDAYLAAFQELVDAAKAKAAYVIVLDGDHPDLSSVSGIDILDYPVPPPDNPDGIHYSQASYKLYAKNVVDLLDSLIA